MPIAKYGLPLIMLFAATTADRAHGYYPANAKATGQIFCLLGEGPAAAACPPAALRTMTPANRPPGTLRRCDACNARPQNPPAPVGPGK